MATDVCSDRWSRILDIRAVTMSSIPAPVQQVLQAQSDALAQKVGTAVLRKQLDAQQQAGDSVNALLTQNIKIQQQLSAGYLDVRA